jgi:hypothetical protein
MRLGEMFEKMAAKNDASGAPCKLRAAHQITIKGDCAMLHVNGGFYLYDWPLLALIEFLPTNLMAQIYH